jgi:hypothetical protein
MFYFVIASSFSYILTPQDVRIASFMGRMEYIGDDVWLIRVSLNSTLESLPLLWGIDWATIATLTGSGINFLGAFRFPVLLILSLSLFSSRCYPFLVFAIKKIDAYRSSSLASFFARSRSSYGTRNRSCRAQGFAFLSSSSSFSQLLEEFLWYGWLGYSSL